MKKQYISPIAEVETLCAFQLLEGSIDDINGGDMGGGGGGSGGGHAPSREEIEELEAEAENSVWGQLW